MPVIDSSTELLTQIRDGVQQLRADLVGRIDQTNARLDQTNAKLDQTNAKLDRTNAKLDQTRTEFLAKLEQTRADLAGQIGETNARLDETNARLDGTNARLGNLERSVSTLTRHVGTIADRGLRLEGDVADLRRRVEVLESHRDE